MLVERIAAFLASGLKPAQIATIIGKSPARISQIMAEDSFQLVLADKESQITQDNVEEVTLAGKYSAVEHLLLNEVMTKAPLAELRDVTAALRVVAERQERAKTRLNPNVPATMQAINIVSINLPAHALPAPVVQQNANNEIVSINEKTLSPLPSQAVTALFAVLNNNRATPKDLERNNHERNGSTASSEARSPVVISQEGDFLSSMAALA